MENKAGVLSNMAVFFLFTAFFFFNPSLVMGDNPFKLINTEGGESGLQTYIVLVKQLKASVSTSSQDQESWYRSFLPVSIASNGGDRMVHSYHNVLSGFAARLSEEEVESMKAKDGFISARVDRLLPLLTTHTPSFLGLHQEMGFWKDSNFGEGVIIGVLDTGIMANHTSFSDEGMLPPPLKWKGICEFNESGCNNKLIGARSFTSGSEAIKRNAAEAPIDNEGHGTHTASTAAGRFVANANVLGNANGTAVGMAPLAYLAIYKVCTEVGCADSDILKGLDTAVEDGVDVLSLSIGGFSAPFYDDIIAIGSFEAVKKGILVSCAAGNAGPFNGSLSNDAPWILTVGASTMDRRIIATAKLGNGEEYVGESLFQPKDFPSTLLPLEYPGKNGDFDMATCTEGSLNNTDLRGKVVLCLRGGETGRVAKGVVVKSAGAAAMILLNREIDGFSTMADAHVLPATQVSFKDALKIMAYLNSTNAPTATIIFDGTILGTSPSPAVASFSSRGPSSVSPGILKPDIIGPGVSVLAAWPFPVEPISYYSGPTFNMVSGTSMSTPHLSGIAALLRSSHPDWSPAAIKSAIMTTADVVDTEGKPIVDETLNPADLFAMGAGHVNPSKANDPGLVYDLGTDDYIPYLCGLGYTNAQVEAITRVAVRCSSNTSISEGELNYPSFSVALGPTQTVNRTVTNVGQVNSSYSLEIVYPQGVDVIVKPETLYFSQVNDKLTFSVTFSRRSSGGPSSFGQGSLNWVSSKYSVRSPISITFK